MNPKGKDFCMKYVGIAENTITPIIGNTTLIVKLLFDKSIRLLTITKRTKNIMIFTTIATTNRICRITHFQDHPRHKEN